MKNAIDNILDDISRFIAPKLNKTYRRSGCAWAECKKCSAKKSEPCKGLWMCEGRDFDITIGLAEYREKQCADKELSYKSHQLAQLKLFTTHWT